MTSTGIRIPTGSRSLVTIRSFSFLTMMTGRKRTSFWKSFADPMKKLQSLVSALGILAVGSLIVGAIVWLLVDAILGGAL
jgi:hypothetical protein